jgi:GTP pyrophosphokinase
MEIHQWAWNPSPKRKRMKRSESESRDWSRLAAASAYAFTIHADHLRKGTNIPYLAHLMSVAALVLEFGGTEDQAIAGLLHDAVEDIGIEQFKEIKERFGPDVARIVKGCTDADSFPKPPWKARKEAHIGHLKDAEPDVLLVSACDKLHNARAIVSDLRTHGRSVFDRFKGGREGTLWYYEELLAVFSRRITECRPLIDSLTEAVRAMGDLDRTTIRNV